MSERSASGKTVILVADDEEAIVTLLAEALRGSDYDVIVAHDGAEALSLVRKSAPDLAVLDVQMPQMSGLSVCQEMKSDTYLRHVPVLLLTSLRGTDSKVSGLSQGADDYMTKPFEMEELLARVQTLLRRTRQGLEANPLTHLPGNGSIEFEILERIKKKMPFAVLYLDLNSFKAYNDTYGFLKGDTVIRETGHLLREEAVAHEAFVGHVGGDDFVILTAPERSEAICRAVIKKFDAHAPTFYSAEDRAQGFVITKDRRGQITKYPLLSIAIGVVTNQLREISSLGEVSSIGAEMKHFAKESDKKGSSYAIDRRRD